MTKLLNIRTLLSIGLLLCGVAIFASTMYFITYWYSNIPYVDEWMEIVDKPSFEYFFRFANDHKIPFPRLIFSFDRALGQHLILTIFTSVLASFFCIYYLFRILFYETELRSKSRYLAVGGMLLTLGFYGVQLYTWSLLLVFFMVMAAGVYAVYAAMIAVRQPEQVDKWFLAKSFFAITVATFSLANGFLSGFAVAAYFLLANAEYRWRLALITLCFTAVLLAVYLDGYSSPARIHWIAMKDDPISAIMADVILSTSAVLGTSVGYPGAVGLGLTMIITAIILFLYAAKKSFPPSLTAFLAISGYGIFSSVLTGIGRIGFTIELLSDTWRYSTYSLVTLLALLCSILHVVWTSELREHIREYLAIGIMSVPIFYAVVTQKSHWASYKKHWEASTREGLSIANGNPGGLVNYFFASDDIKKRAEILAKHDRSFYSKGFHHYFDRNIADVDLPTASECSGRVVRFIFINTKTNMKHGFGWAAVNKRPADYILITDSTGQVVAVGFTGYPGEKYKDAQGKRTGWVTRFNSARDGKTVYEAYAVSNEHGICKLEQ